MPDYKFLLTTRLSQDQQHAVQLLQQVSRAAGLNLYLTGGAMRDLLANRPARFLEFTTEGDPVPLAPKLQAAGAERINPQPEQRTVGMMLRGVRLRLRAARNPAGAAAAISEDLRGRGLTLNAIGLSLNPASAWLLLDPTNGVADIEARLVRVSRPDAFLDEPILMLRALRMATRLEFALEERTRERLHEAREGNYLARVKPAALGLEIEAIAYEPDPAAVLKELERDGWLEAVLGGGVRAARMNLTVLGRLAEAVETWERLGLVVDSGLVAVALMLIGLPPAEQTRWSRMLPSRHLTEEGKKLPQEAKAFERKLLALAAPVLPKALALMEKTQPGAVVYASLCPSDAKTARKLRDFQAAALQHRDRLPQGLLRSLGVAPRSVAGEKILLPLFRRLLTGETITDQELADQIRTAVVGHAPAPPPTRPQRGRGAKAAAAPVPAPRPPAPPAAAPPAPKTKPAAARPPAPAAPALPAAARRAQPRPASKKAPVRRPSVKTRTTRKAKRR